MTDNKLTDSEPSEESARGRDSARGATERRENRMTKSLARESKSDLARDTTMTEQNLKDEIEKWQKKIVDKIQFMELTEKENKEHQRMLKNIHAYINDCKHFQNKNDLVMAFECVVWSWAWLEILEQLEILKQKK